MLTSYKFRIQIVNHTRVLHRSTSERQIFPRHNIISELREFRQVLFIPNFYPFRVFDSLALCLVLTIVHVTVYKSRERKLTDPVHAVIFRPVHRNHMSPRLINSGLRCHHGIIASLVRCEIDFSVRLECIDDTIAVYSCRFVCQCRKSMRVWYACSIGDAIPLQGVRLACDFAPGVSRFCRCLGPGWHVAGRHRGRLILNDRPVYRGQCATLNFLQSIIQIIAQKCREDGCCLCGSVVTPAVQALIACTATFATSTLCRACTECRQSTCCIQTRSLSCIRNTCQWKCAALLIIADFNITDSDTLEEIYQFLCSIFLILAQELVICRAVLCQGPRFIGIGGPGSFVCLQCLVCLFCKRSLICWQCMPHVVTLCPGRRTTTPAGSLSPLSGKHLDINHC